MTPLRWLIAGCVVAGCSTSDGAGTTTGVAATSVVTTTDPVTTSTSPTQDHLEPRVAASCASDYNPAALAMRSWAFDGTIVATSSGQDSQLGQVPITTFAVNHWYKGGDVGTITVESAIENGAERLPDQVGSRLLVTGEPRWGGAPFDDTVAWGCGFTQTWTEAAAQEWESTFAPASAGPAPPALPSPDLGEFDDIHALVAALQAFGPLDNEAPAAVAEGIAPNESICASIVMNNEPSAGPVVFQGDATFAGVTGVVLVLRHPDDSNEVRMYSVHEADPVTGGCPLLASAPLDST